MPQTPSVSPSQSASMNSVLRSLRPQMPRAWDLLATTLASLAIVLIILVVVAANREQLAQLGPALALGMLALNLGAYGSEYYTMTGNLGGAYVETDADGREGLEPLNDPSTFGEGRLIRVGINVDW